MKNNKVELTVLVNGRDIQEFEKDSKSFVEGEEGREYALRLVNHGDYKIKAVVGIDGINIVNGQPVGEDPKEMGYILGAGETTKIKGYRLDEENVASFRFTDGKSAYANTVKGMGGKTQGVISARIYREKDNIQDKLDKMTEEWRKQAKQKPEKEYVPYPVYPSWPTYPRPWYDEWKTPIWTTGPYYITCKSSDSTDMVFNPSVQAMNHAENLQGMNNCADFSANVGSVIVEETEAFPLGSTFGTKLEQKVVETPFEVGDFLCELVIYYSTRESLVKLGIEFKKVAKISSFPEHKPGKYCQVPSGWTG